MNASRQTRMRHRAAEREAEKEKFTVMSIMSKSGTVQTTLRNDTPYELIIKGADGRQIILAPLELRQFKPEVIKGFELDEAALAGKIGKWDSPPSELVETVFGWVFGLGFWVVIACLIIGSMDKPNFSFWGMSWKKTVWVAGSVIVGGFVLWTWVREKKALGLVLRFLAQMLSLLVILAIGLGLPAATVYFFGDGKALLTSPSPMLFARLLQVAFIATASLLPVLLFFLFDRYQLNTLRNRLYRDLFRLDRRLTTRSEIDAKYGSQIHEAYGPEEQGTGRLARGTRWPVLLCAFVVTMGWLIAFKPVGAISPELALRPLLPERSVLTFGFLGAYFFGLQLVARRYARGDLKPKAYGYITIRILVVAVLSWVLEVFSEVSIVTLVFAFLIGILPDEFFTLIKEKFRSHKVAKFLPDPEPHPLTKLEGIDLYDRARLEQEGIVNVESYAHNDLIHLVLETRIPVPQLVDWMDQAILYLHTTEMTSKAEQDEDEPTNDEMVVKKPKQSSKETARERLRYYGIRTATDFLGCWDAAKERDRGDGESAKEAGHIHLDEFKKLLGGASKPYRLEVIRDALLDDEWLRHVEYWRKPEDREEREIFAIPKSYEGTLSWAKELENTHRFSEAIIAFNKAIEIRDEAEARIRLAVLFGTSPVISLRDDNRYRENVKRAFELGKDNVDILIQLVSIQDKMGDKNDALVACELAIKLLGDPKDDEEKSQKLKDLKTIWSTLELAKIDSAKSASP